MGRDPKWDLNQCKKICVPDVRSDALTVELTRHIFGLVYRRAPVRIPTRWGSGRGAPLGVCGKPFSADDICVAVKKPPR